MMNSEKKYIGTRVFFIILVCCLGNILWIHLDKRIPLSQDCIKHLVINYYYHEIIQSNGWLKFFLSLKTIHPPYPPFFHIITQVFYAFIEPSIETAVIANTPYIILTILGVYRIGKTMGGRETGFLAAFLVASWPFISSAWHFPNLEPAVTAATTVTLYLILKTKNFMNSRFSLFLGISLGLGLLIKWTFPVYVTPLFIITFFSGLKEKNLHGELGPELHRRGVNAAIALVISLFISLPWYYDMLGFIKEFSDVSHQLVTSMGSRNFSTENFFYYPKHFYYNFTFFHIALIVVGSIQAFLNKKKNLLEYFLLLNFMISFSIFFLFIGIKDIRYIGPALPALAVLSVSWMDGKLPVVSKKIVASTIMIFGVLVYFSVNWGIGISQGHLKIDGFSRLDLPTTPQKNDLGAEDIFNILWDKERSKTAKPITVAVVPHLPNCLEVVFSYYSDFIHLGNFSKRVRFVDVNKDNYLDVFKNADYIIVNSRGDLPHWRKYFYHYGPWAEQRRGENATLPKRYLEDKRNIDALKIKKVGLVQLKDGSYTNIYVSKKRRVEFKELAIEPRKVDFNIYGFFLRRWE